MSKDDWKKEQDRKVEQKRLEEQRKWQAEQEARRKAQALEEERNRQRQQAEYDRSLKELQRKFRCDICGVLPTEPGTIYESYTYRNPNDYDDDDSLTDYKEVKTWSVPGGLTKCTICEKWFCSQHIHNGICERDAKKGYLPGDKKRGIFG